MNDAADHPPVIDMGLAPRIRRQQRLQLQKMLIAEPEQSIRNRQTPVQELESNSD